MVRRCLVSDRFVYTHVVVTSALDPKLEVLQADRIFVFDRKTGVIVLSDAFSGLRPLLFATHLHCSGSITEPREGVYRMTGGQANLIAGIKGGSKDLDDAERGEIFVEVLRASTSARVAVEEPTWVPGYIYGLNLTGREELSDGRFPRYKRWRLEAAERVTQGSFLIALSPQPCMAKLVEGDVLLPQGGVSLGFGTRSAMGVQCQCECLLWDESAQRLIAMGAVSLEHEGRSLMFSSPVDLEYSVDAGRGTAYSQSMQPGAGEGFSLEPWLPIGEESWRTHASLRLSFEKR